MSGAGRALAACGLAVAVAVAGCGSPAAGRPPEVDPLVERVADHLTGVFSSAEQAAARPDDYFEIRLVSFPVWVERADGPWLYVEQAAAGALDRPYRQRVYHLVRDGETVVSEVYVLPDPAAAVGCWREAEPLAGLSPQDLERRTGCEIVLLPLGEHEFRGSTVGRRCPSELAGAAYATSQVTLRDGLLESWDRGFDADGQQVWGAEKGPYRFLREGPVHAGVPTDG